MKLNATARCGCAGLVWIALANSRNQRGRRSEVLRSLQLKQTRHHEEGPSRATCLQDEIGVENTEGHKV